MKFGRIFTYLNREEAKELIGKKVVFADSLKWLSDLGNKDIPIDLCEEDFSVLKKVTDKDDPFVCEVESSCHWLAIREVIEEDPKYRPFTNEELNEQVGKVVQHKSSGERTIITCYISAHCEVNLSKNGMWSAEELLYDWVFADGTPCGVKKD